MKSYSVPSFVLIAASLLLLLLALNCVERSGRVTAGLAQARRSIEDARRDLASAQALAAKAKVSGAPVEAYLSGWNAELDAEGNIEQVFGRLDTLAVNNLLSPSGKNFAARPNYLFLSRHMPVQNVNITVAGEYYRMLNWLGAVEYAFPLARVEQASFIANGNSLSLALELVFPRRFEAQ
jgi:hypothetical protein